MTKNDQQDFITLLDFLKRNRGFDFSGYKSASLMRRIQKRMQMIEVASYADYIDFLEVHPEEFTHLFNTILINVTSFFRDPLTWEYLSAEIVPKILEGKRTDESLRAWSTGCASGEEAYSVAMILAEVMGEKEFSERVKIYATDVDEEALAKARLAQYTAKDLEAVPAALREKYFTPNGGGLYSFHKDLRKCVIFGRNDLIQDAPISRIDLLVCRNTLMYFNAETQAKVLARFHFALRDSGYLFLGKAEMLLTHTNIFSPVDLKLRIFTKVPKVNLRDRLMIMAHTGSEDGVNQLFSQVRLRDAAFEATPVAHVVVDANNFLVMTNAQARALFDLRPRDIGRPFQDLEFSYRPVELRSAIEQAGRERIPIILRDVEWYKNTGESQYFDVRIQPLMDNGNGYLGVQISFINISQHKKLQSQLEQANHELETAFEELQSTNEELETTNEELQSTNEELETTNEELQSTNEELETMNEELQSTNEELHTINDELGLRTDELRRVNSFLEAVLSGVRSGVVVLDRDLRVQVWNHKAEDLWGLRAVEVHGQNFLNLDIGLPVERLKGPFRTLLKDGMDYQELTLPARNRRGKDILCKLIITPFTNNSQLVDGLITLMEEVDSQPG
jgi:two-component system CheB/CheR fusion protein